MVRGDSDASDGIKEQLTGACLSGLATAEAPERWRCRGCLGGRLGAQPESTNIIVMGAIHTNCAMAVLMVVVMKCVVRRVDEDS